MKRESEEAPPKRRSRSDSVHEAALTFFRLSGLNVGYDRVRIETGSAILSAARAEEAQPGHKHVVKLPINFILQCRSAASLFKGDPPVRASFLLNGSLKYIQGGLREYAV